MNYCAQRSVVCESANEFGHCMFTGCTRSYTTVQENQRTLTFLSIDDLKARDGLPVFCMDSEGKAAWGLVNVAMEACIDSECELWLFNQYATEKGFHWVAIIP